MVQVNKVQFLKLGLPSIFSIKKIIIKAITQSLHICNFTVAMLRSICDLILLKQKV